MVEPPILPCSALPIQDEHAAGAASRRGLLGDQLWWKFEVEIGDQHRPDCMKDAAIRGILKEEDASWRQRLMSRLRSTYALLMSPTPSTWMERLRNVQWGSSITHPGKRRFRLGFGSIGTNGAFAPCLSCGLKLRPLAIVFPMSPCSIEAGRRSRSLRILLSPFSRFCL